MFARTDKALRCLSISASSSPCLVNKCPRYFNYCTVLRENKIAEINFKGQCEPAVAHTFHVQQSKWEYPKQRSGPVQPQLQKRIDECWWSGRGVWFLFLFPDETFMIIRQKCFVCVSYNAKFYVSVLHCLRLLVKLERKRHSCPMLEITKVISS